MENTIKLDLTVDEVNTILRSLGQHPFIQIADLIAKIKYQGDSQIDAINAAAANAEDTGAAGAN